MKMMPMKRLFFAGVLCALGFACSHPPLISRETASSMTKPVVVTDGGYSLSGYQLFTALENTILLPSGGRLSDSVVKAFLDSMVVDTLTSLEAWKVPLERYRIEYRDVRHQWEHALASIFFKHAVESYVRIDSQQVLDFYEQHKNQFVVPEQAEVSHILVSPTYLRKGPDSLKYTDMTRYKIDTIAHAMVDSVYQLLQAGTSFKKVAEQFSHDQSSKSNGGYVGWCSRGVYMPPFDSVTFQLQPGQFSRPYRDADGFHIIHVADRIAAGPLPISRAGVFEQVSSVAKSTAETERGAAVLDSLLKGLTVDFNPDVADSTILSSPDSVWYAVVNGVDTLDVLLVKNQIDVYKKNHVPPIKVLTADQKKQAIELLIQRALYIEGGRAAGLDTLPEFLGRKRQTQFGAGRGILVRGWYGDAWEPSDSAVAAYYNAHIKEYQFPKPLIVQQIVAKDSTTAEFVRDQAASGIDFLDLAQQYYRGDSVVRRQLADLGQIGPDDVDTAFYRAAQLTQVGEISKVVKTRYGYQVIKVLARQESIGLPLARTKIAETLRQIHRCEMFSQTKARLMAQYHAKFPNKIGPVFLEPISYRQKH
jgi:parvulin-like peptidyl-prolyl isomerase